jgi:MFS family permease
MKIFLRHLVICALPMLFAAGSGYYFTTIQGSCGAMVGALFSGKCAGRQRQYLVWFQLGGGAAGTLIAATLGTWLEHRRRRAVQPTTSEGEPS